MKTNQLIVEAVQRIHKKDQVAMKVVYNHFAKEMLTLAMRITRNKNDAEDIIQDAFIQSFQKINQLRQPEQYAFWLKRIVANYSIKLIKKRVHFADVPAEVLEDVEEEDSWYRKVKFESINQAIQKLPDGCREILTLYLLDGFKHREIADLFDIAESTSKSQYRYALKLLKKQLKIYQHG